MLDIKWTRRARRRVGTRARTCPSPDHCRRTDREGFGDKLWTNVVDMGVDGTCGDDQLFASDDLGGGAYDQTGVDAIHVIRVTSLSDANDDTIPNANICLG